MRGLLVVNHFVHSEKFDEIYRWLCVASGKKETTLEQCTNADIITRSMNAYDWLTKDKGGFDFVLFWDKDVRLAQWLESCGLRVFNSSDSIELCDDKYKTYVALKNQGIVMPKTILVPMSYYPVDWRNTEYVHAVGESLGFPLILKECYGSFGKQVYLAKNTEELLSHMNSISNRPMLIQEYIATSKGRDIRLNIVGGKVVACMYRYAIDDDFRANITNGAKMKKHDPTNEQIEMALSACELLGLDFGGVDVLFGDNETPVLCEVNSNAHFKNIFDCTGINVADHIIEYIIERCYG